ncbi:MAG: glycerate kinase type-2 family protein [Rhodospirillales bacterium]
MTPPAPRTEPEAFLRALLDAALAAADPAHCTRAALPKTAPAGRILVLGAGKASAAMARALEDHAAAHWPGAELRGLVVTRDGCEVPCAQIEITAAGHPEPDERGLHAAGRILELAQAAGENDFVIHLISGGGSALMPLPAPGLTLADKQAVNAALLRSGAPISEINCLRKHLSAVKGGRLARAAAPARQLTLAISDVPGDDPAVIASGPTVPDPSTFADARVVAHARGLYVAHARGLYGARARELQLPPAVKAFLDAGADETPKPGDPVFTGARCEIIARPQMSLDAAEAAAKAAGCDTEILGDAIEGEAREAGREHARLVLARRAAGLTRPLVLISGGETTVTVRGQGRGGPNTEYLLAFAMETQGAEGIFALACDTDGADGPGDIAGALCGPDTLARARRAGVSAPERLADNDARGFFEAAGGLVITGPTLTNVNDFRAALALP